MYSTLTYLYFEKHNTYTVYALSKWVCHHMNRIINNYGFFFSGRSIYAGDAGGGALRCWYGNGSDGDCVPAQAFLSQLLRLVCVSINNVTYISHSRSRTSLQDSHYSSHQFQCLLLMLIKIRISFCCLYIWWAGIEKIIK